MRPTTLYVYDADDLCYHVVEHPVYSPRLQISLVIVLGVILGIAGAVWLDATRQAPHARALQAENESLLAALDAARSKLDGLSEQLNGYATADRDFYGVLLNQEPLSEDVRQVGVGGSPLYPAFRRYSPEASERMLQSALKMDALERRLVLQENRYATLEEQALHQEEALAQTPAINPVDGNVVSHYGWRRHPVLKRYQKHHGLDLLVWTGTPVHVTADGVVMNAGYRGGYGRFVEIEHPISGYVTRYAHLSRIKPHIKPGAVVSRGDVIALSGNTGLSSGPHLHYEVRDTSGASLNPKQFIAYGLSPDQYVAQKKAQQPALAVAK